MAENNTLWISGTGGLWNSMLYFRVASGEVDELRAVVVRWDRGLS